MDGGGRLAGCDSGEGAIEETGSFWDLQGSESRYRLLVENAQEGIWAIDAKANTTFVSQRMAEILGYTINEMTGQPLFSFMSEEDISEAKGYLERRRRSIKERHDFEFVRKDGTRVYTSLEASPIFNESALFCGAIAYVCDITERRRMEAALKEREEMYKLLFENANDGIVLHGLTEDGLPERFLQVNDVMCRMLGCTKEELLQLTPMDIQEEGPDDVLIERQKIKSHDKSILFERTLIAKDGRRIPVEIQSTLLDLRKRPVVLSVIRDITDRKFIEEERERLLGRLHEEKIKLMALLKSIPDEVWFCDAEGNVSLLNEAAIRWADLINPGDGEAKDWISRLEILELDGQPRPIEDSPLLRSLKGEAIKGDEMVCNHASGEMRYRQFSSAPITLEDGRIIGAVATVRDITDRKIMEEALSKSRDFLDKIINSIGDPIFVKDRQHRYVLVNDAQSNLVGHTHEELIGKTSYDLFPKEQADVFCKNDDEVFETGRENFNEEKVTGVGGTIRTVITRKTLYKDKSGNEFLVGIARDITDRKLMENELRAARADLERRVAERTVELEKANLALRNSKDYLDKIINSIGDPIFVKDRQHRLILVNDAACKLFGRSRADLLGRTSHDLFPTKEMAEISWHKDEEVFRTGEENVNEETNTYAPGVTLTVLVKKTLYEDNAGNRFLVGVTRDITDRKKAEEALRESERRLTDIIDFLPDATLVIDKEGRVMAWNRAIEAMTGIAAEDIIGKGNYEYALPFYGERRPILIDLVLKTK